MPHYEKKKKRGGLCVPEDLHMPRIHRRMVRQVWHRDPGRVSRVLGRGGIVGIVMIDGRRDLEREASRQALGRAFHGRCGVGWERVFTLQTELK